jgi:hypothetical protein
MNKMSGTKGLYRGLGSIDIAAAARSILLIGRHGDSGGTRVMAHLKSNLAPEGNPIAFNLDGTNGFEWIGSCSASIDEILYSSSGTSAKRETKEQQAMSIIREQLVDGERLATDMYDLLGLNGISKRTGDNAKHRLNVGSIKKGDKWYWTMY